jgi:sigma-B regulation protein RsbU (phosphoserine phosphatase)
MAKLSPVRLGTIISLGFLPMLLVRQFLLGWVVSGTDPLQQPKRAFLLEFGVCLGASLLVNGFDFIVLGFPFSTLTSFFIGCIIAGFFIGLDSSLLQERKIIHEATERDAKAPLSTHFFSLTHKYALMAGTTTVLVSLVLIMVFVRDVEWLVLIDQDADSIMNARLSVIYEILFIMGIPMVMVTNLIFSYSKNLKLLFDNQTKVLEQVRNGDLTRKVPVATRDEFGVIAEHTNHMIEGLRHRFELMTALQLAEEVQQNLLPSKSPYLQRYDISGTSIYCDQTGGDYYDYFLLPDNKFGIVVADACGHGVSAALLMTTVRAFLISAIQEYRDPACLVSELNRILTKDSAASGSFSSMFFLELDQNAQDIRWIRAGHDPALVYHKESRKFTRLEGPGGVLGVEESFTYENQSSGDFQNGDIIVIGTDGIYETASPENRAFGRERAQDVIRDYCDASAHTIQQALVSEVRRFRCDLTLEDDITLVVIKVK